jgi:hypothetical protein
MAETTPCACGRPLHYSDPSVQRRVQALVDQLGADIVVTLGDRSWSVQRHYIALHGLKATELPTLGFPMVERVTNG